MTLIVLIDIIIFNRLGGGVVLKVSRINTVAGILYIFLAALFICVTGSVLSFFKISYTAKIIMVILSFALAFTASYLLVKKEKSEKRKYRIVKITTLLLFLLYLTVVIDFTLINDHFGRSISNFFALSGEEKRLYLEAHTNFVPFHTVKFFIDGYRNNYFSLFETAENLLGNFLVLAPLAFFMPIFFNFANNLLKFLASIIFFVIAIEILQIIFLSGAADVDDLILNTLGALLAFMILKSKKVSEKLSAFTFKVWKKD